MAKQKKYDRAFYGWELNNFLSDYSQDLYLGCYPRSDVPMLLPGQACIVNSSASGPGNHWSCFAYSVIHGFMVFDSNGTNIATIREFYPYKLPILCHYNVERLTHPETSYCGLYSSFFASMFF
jgi:hypothetical protein